MGVLALLLFLFRLHSSDSAFDRIRECVGDPIGRHYHSGVFPNSAYRCACIASRLPAFNSAVIRYKRFPRFQFAIELPN